MWQIAAMIIAAAMQQHAQSQALKRQQQQAAEMRQRQLNAQNQATAEAGKRASEFDPTARRQAQDEIQQDLTDTYSKQVEQPQITAQGVQVGQTIQGGTADYTAAKARETAKTTESLRALASLMGRIGSASELRRKEAIGMGDTAGAIGRIQNGAANVAGIDQIGINAVQPSPGLMLASEALRAYGSGAFGGAGSAGGGAASTSYANPGMGQMTNVPRGSWLR